MVLVVVVERHAVELLKWVYHLTTWRGDPAFQAHPPLLAYLPRPANVDALALLDIAEIDRVDASPLARHDGWLHVSDERPLRLPEKAVRLDVGCASMRSEPSSLILDQ